MSVEEQRAALNESHQRLDEQLSLLEADLDAEGGVSALASAWRHRIDAARKAALRPVEIAFVAQAGCGKSTLIATATGMRLQEEGSPKKWSVLPVADGRTTVGETHVHLEDRAGILLRVEPLDRDSLVTELRLLAEDTWERAQGASRSPASAERVAGEELYALLSRWLEPSADSPRDALYALTEQHDSVQGYTETVLSRVDFEARCEPLEVEFSNDEDGLSALRTMLSEVMEGVDERAPAPQVVHVHMPRAEGLEGVDTLIDTQGLEPGVSRALIEGREGLHTLLTDPHYLLVVCSGYEAAPDAVSAEVLRYVQEHAEGGSLAELVVRLILVDKRDDADNDKDRRQRRERIAQCYDRLTRGELAVGIVKENIDAIDARRQRDELRTQLRMMSDAALKKRHAAWSTTLDEATVALRPLDEVERAERTFLDLKLWWAWDAALGGVEFGSGSAFEALADVMRTRDSRIHHVSYLNAAVRRGGRYLNKLDLAWLGATEAAQRALAPFKVAAKAAEVVLSERVTGSPDDPISVHAVMRIHQIRDAVTSTQSELTVAWWKALKRYFGAPGAQDMWRRCRQQWGLASGQYRADIADIIAAEAERAQLRLCGDDVPKSPEQRLSPRPALFRLNSLRLTNYRGTADGQVVLSETTVLIGDNGLGKTGWLEGAAAAIGTLLPGLGGGQTPPIREADIRTVTKQVRGVADRQLQLPVVVAATAIVQGRRLGWERRVDTPPLAGEAPLERLDEVADDDALRLTAERIGQDVREHKVRELPVLCYYGTQRLWPSDLEAEKERRPAGSRLDGYRDCLKAASTHKNVLDWMWRYTLVQFQRKKPVVQLQGIERAVVACVEGASQFFFDVDLDDLVLTMKNGEVWPFRQLSDGYRNVIAMVADIAWRASVLNPQLGARAPVLAEGVVLIDEVDLHLHPSWQRHVMPDLRRAFPRLQFIVTTHSPFIIQSLEPGQLVNLDPDLDPDAKEAPYADESPEDIAEHHMGVDVPQRSWRRRQAADVAERYYSLLDRVPYADEDELSKLRAELDELLAPYNENQAFAVLLERKRALAEASRS